MFSLTEKKEVKCAEQINLTKKNLFIKCVGFNVRCQPRLHLWVSLKSACAFMKLGGIKGAGNVEASVHYLLSSSW